VARQLLVSVGDEVTIQVVRAIASDGEEAGSLSQRRLEVVGLVRTGNPEIDDRVAFLQMDTLTGMLGTDGPNEVVVMLDDIRRLTVAQEEARAALAGMGSIQVHTWAERNPALKSLIEVDSESGSLMYVILFLLVALGVVNATLMSVLERVKEFGVMLALGTRRAMIFNLVMTEVALLGFLAVGVGSFLGGCLEVFGRTHGWPLEWFGYQEMEGSSMSGVVYESIYFSGLTPANGAVIVIGVYVMFLIAGLMPAIRAARLQPVEAMRTK
jgi:ABC-type lipoprotein release transport system permease subunit